MKTKLKKPPKELSDWVKQHEEETSKLNDFTLEQRRIFRLGLWSMWHKLNPEK